MRMYTEVLVLLLLLIAIPDVIFYLKLKDRNAKPIYIFLHLLFPVFFSGLFIYIKYNLIHFNNIRYVVWIMWLYFTFFLIYIPKLIHILFYFINFVYKKIFKHDYIYFKVIRIGLSIFVVITMLISAYITPRDFETIHIKIKEKNIPRSFEGYKIVQISDAHLGSWNHKYNQLERIIELVNQQHPDIIVFTGDMVNNFGSETDGWLPYFKKLKSKYGKYAIVGNHDYGDYIEWKSIKDKSRNQLKISRSIENMGFQLLLNQHVYLRKDSDSLMLVGVENWGDRKNTRYCNLQKALAGTKPEDLKILLSHNPNHWEAEVLNKHEDIFLTLSGHTHAGQLGFKIGSRLFSPAAFIFKYWNGLYKVNNQYIYVNKGLGYIGLPMYVGVRPEITVIKLTKDK